MPISLLATSLKAATRSLLLSLGMDHALIDFLANTAVGAATVLLAILFVALRIPDRRSASREDTYALNRTDLFIETESTRDSKPVSAHRATSRAQC
jgi:hypothetical protein